MFERAIQAGPRVARIRSTTAPTCLGLRASTLRRSSLGVVFARVGDPAEARRCFDRALRYDPRNRVATDNLKALGRDGPPPPR